MEDFGEEVTCVHLCTTFRRIVGEVAFYGQLTAEDPASVGRVHRANNVGLHVEQIGFIENYVHTFDNENALQSGLFLTHSASCLPMTIAMRGLTLDS